MEKASEALQRRRMNRLELLEKALEDPCKRECNGQRPQCAKYLHVMRWNDVSVNTFMQAVRTLLEQGRGNLEISL